MSWKAGSKTRLAQAETRGLDVTNSILWQNQRSDHLLFIKKVLCCFSQYQCLNTFYYNLTVLMLAFKAISYCLKKKNLTLHYEYVVALTMVKKKKCSTEKINNKLGH